MPRERTTWNRTEIARTAGLKVADPYTMNQDHPQPKADAYVTGDPSSFGEDVHPANGTWEAEYAGGQVKRNEIGMPEMRGDTFNHPEKTASEEVLTKKAALCVAIARAILPKTASSTEIEDQSLSFMHLPDSEVMSTYTRLAQDQKEGQEEQVQAQAQQKQGGEMPPQFKENAEKKKEEAEAKKEQDKKAQDQKEGQGQQDQGQAQGQQKQAQQDQIAQLQQQAQQIQQQIAQLQQQAQAQQQAPVAQGQQVQSQAQQVAQAVQQAIAQGQDPVQAVQQIMQQQVPVAQQQAPVGQDAELIDAMLAQDPIQAPTAEMEIQIETPSMDVGEVQLGPEDDVLNQLFASNAEVRLAQQAQGQDPDQDQGQAQQKQAHVVRTASMRTVGTRPTGGVSQIGGLPSAGSSGGGDKLSSLWNSAPDVREAFGLPTNR